tara:strand:+ start:1940 stop:2269 length:330 start_codon:yes stop_codon:yes gene_type:complete
MKDLSADYHNLRYAILTLCDTIENCEFKKIVEERYLPVLDTLTEKMTELKGRMKEEKEDIEKQNKRWHTKIHSLVVDAKLDQQITEEMRERLISSLEDLSEKVLRHEDL